MADPGSVPMSEPLAYFLTWTTYGTWLPGDERGWVRAGQGFQVPDYRVEHEARRKLNESPCVLDNVQREIVEATIRRHCDIRKWELHAIAGRTNHVHVVVSAPVKPKIVMEQLKAWCSRRLNENTRERGLADRKDWWTENGSKRFLNDLASLEAAILYVVEGQ